jgi:hypothetical protein
MGTTVNGLRFLREKEKSKIDFEPLCLFISLILQIGSSQPYFIIFMGFGLYYLYGE